MTVIEARNIGKRYSLHRSNASYRALRDDIMNAFHWFTHGRGKRRDTDEFWALRDIDFSVQQGEVLGIIGPNGSGKSTLLKILSRITPPTTGEVKIRGRVGSLLEVGTGFHPELTGRENIFLNGAILGMGKKEITRKMDEIVAFSGIEKFLDTPVKYYSSGMYVRLAFAIAAHMDPDILLVDEVLAVGDAEFQKKCLGKMEEITKKQGRTILFVSHNMGAILRLCQRCIWIRSGGIYRDDLSNKVVPEYLNETQNSTGQVFWDKECAPGDSENINFISVKIINSKGISTSRILAEEPFCIELEYEVLQILKGAWIGFKMSTNNGEIVFCSGDHNFALNIPINRNPGIYKSRCHIPANLLNQGSYFIGLLGHIPGVQSLFDEDNVLCFEVAQQTDISGGGRQPGIIRPNLLWEIIPVH